MRSPPAAARELAAANSERTPPTPLFGGDDPVPWFFVMDVGSIVASVGAGGLLLFRRGR